MRQMPDGNTPALATLLQALHDTDDEVPSSAARAIVEIGPRVLPAVAPLLNVGQWRVRAQAIWIARTLAADRVNGGVRVGWPAELHRLMAAYEDDMSSAERARLTRAVESMIAAYEAQLRA
jgi:HEAT repeat protein